MKERTVILWNGRFNFLAQMYGIEDDQEAIHVVLNAEAIEMLKKLFLEMEGETNEAN